MANITKRQTISLLRKLQKFQIEDWGKHRIELRLYRNDNGCLWFCGTAFKTDDTLVNVSCYEWRSYEQNKEEIEKFISTINND